MKGKAFTLIYGTGNQSKVAHMRKMIEPLPLVIEGIITYLNPLPTVKEVGKNPLDNAIEKATTYYNLLKCPVFSCDSGLFIQGLKENLQPGVHVRRINREVLTDEEMIAYYSNIAKKIARYHNAICLVMDQEHVYSSMEPNLSGEPFIISAIAHEKRRKGYPIDSLSIDMSSGKYYFDRPAFFPGGAAKEYQYFFIEAFKKMGYTMVE